MNNNRVLSGSVSIAWEEYKKWILNPRMILVVILGIIMNDSIIKPLLERVDKMGEPINLIEPFIAMGNSGTFILFLSIVYLVLMADFPRVDGNTSFIMIRTGRTAWFLGQILFAMMSAVTYLVLLFLETMVLCSSKAYLYNGWSLVATDYDLRYKDAVGSKVSELLPANLYNQMSPYKTAVLTGILTILYFLLLDMMMLLFYSMKCKKMGFVLSVSLIALGSAFCATKTAAMWLFPMAHSIVWVHFDKFYRDEIVKIGWSILYFIILIGILFMVVYRGMKYLNFTSVEETD